MTPGDTTPKTCRYGHGLLKMEDGYWGMPRIRHEKVGLLGTDRLLGPDGNSYLVVRVLACPVCGYIELSESPV